MLYIKSIFTLLSNDIFIHSELHDLLLYCQWFSYVRILHTTSNTTYNSFTPLAHNSLSMLLIIMQVNDCLKMRVESTNLPLLPADPKLMESTQTRQNTSTQPAAIPALNRVSRGMDLGLPSNRTPNQKKE